MVFPRFIDVCIETSFTVSNCLINKEILSHVYGKCGFVPRDQVFSQFCWFFLLLITTKKIGSFTLASSTSTVLHWFYILIFYFKNFSTWIWRFPLAWLEISLNGNSPGPTTSTSFPGFSPTRPYGSSVAADPKVSPNWSLKTITCHSSHCFSIVWG